MPLPERIPVYFLSGFLGSGKSTLLNQFLSDAAFHDTAVIINEFGDVPVDHLLVRKGETTIRQVSSGCLCCSGSSDIRTTLLDLHYAAKSEPSVLFSRVIVEMSGLGDPAPLVNGLSATRSDKVAPHHEVGEGAFYIAGFVTLFDVISGIHSLENHFEALKQIAFADRIILTKTDLVSDLESQIDISSVKDELRAINAGADIIDRQILDLSEVFSPRPYSIVDRGEDVAGWLALEAAMAMEVQHSAYAKTDTKKARHGSSIRTFTIVCDDPLPEARIGKFLSALGSAAGPGLLRVKGIIGTEREPERPLIVHAVQHVISNPVRLRAWPDSDRRTRLVFITSGIDPEPVRNLFTAIVSKQSTSLTMMIKNLFRSLGTYFSKRISPLTNISRRTP